MHTTPQTAWKSRTARGAASAQDPASGAAHSFASRPTEPVPPTGSPPPQPPAEVPAYSSRASVRPLRAGASSESRFRTPTARGGGVGCSGRAWRPALRSTGRSRRRSPTTPGLMCSLLRGVGVSGRLGKVGFGCKCCLTLRLGGRGICGGGGA